MKAIPSRTARYRVLLAVMVLVTLGSWAAIAFFETRENEGAAVAATAFVGPALAGTIGLAGIAYKARQRMSEEKYLRTWRNTTYWSLRVTPFVALIGVTTLILNIVSFHIPILNPFVAVGLIIAGTGLWLTARASSKDPRYQEWISKQ